MTDRLKVLIVGGGHTHADAILAALRQKGFDPEAVIIEAHADLARVLAHPFDLVCAGPGVAENVALDAMMQTPHILIAMLDTDFRYICVNDTFAQFHAQPPTYFPGKRVYDQFPQFASLDALSAAIQAGQPYTQTAWPYHAPGTPDRVTYWDWTLAPVMDGREVRGLLLTLLNVTERVEAQEALRTQREEHDFAAALSEIAAVLNSTLDGDSVIDRILETLKRVLPHDAANVMLIEQDYVRVIGHRGYAERGLKEWVEALRWPLDDMPNLRQQVESKQPLAIPDVHAYEGWISLNGSAWIRSLATAPLILDGAVVGFLSLDKAEPNFYTQKHADRLLTFANQASVAIKNARLYDMVQRHAAELTQRVETSTAELRESEARYRAIVEDQTELIVRYLSDWTVTFVNRACSRHFDAPAESLIGRSFLSFMPDEDREPVADLLSTLTVENPAQVIEHRFYRPHGEMTWLQWTCRLIADTGGRAVEYQAVGQDVTERRKAEEVMRKALAREIQLGEMKSQFVSLVSHEFRNPLAVIQMNSDMLRRYHDRLTPDQREEYHASTRTHVRDMTDLLDDLLLISQSETGKLEVKPEPVELDNLCQIIIGDVRTTYGANREFDFIASNSCDVITDPKLFRLILANLVTNAAKYTRSGGRIEVRLICGGERIILRVADNGIGIPQADVERLFDAFHRASNVGAVSGTGLGLTLVKQCVELLGGTIAIESKEGLGTTVNVVLPRETLPVRVSGILS